MEHSRSGRWWIVPTFLVTVVVLSAGLWRAGYERALGQLSQRASADLALAGDRLITQLETYRELAVLMADHPALTDLKDPSARERARDVLLQAADKAGALDLVVADADGRALAAAKGLIGRDVSSLPAFTRAMHGALGRGHGRLDPSDRRAFTYAAPAFDARGKVRGAVLIAADVEDIENAWRGSIPAVFFTDTGGEVFVSNRSELISWRRSDGRAGLEPPDGTERPFGMARVGGHEIWHLGWGPYLPARALHLQRPLPVIGLMAEVLVDASPARRAATLQAATVAAICLAFGALLFLATERRRALAQVNAVLESRVAQRTRALSETNARLRREVGERQDAEAALKRAQDDLVQAGKLSALGQMSAGISHELNQPLMAIQSFAENASEYLARGRHDVARANMGRIAELSRRMGRIIRNLRAFSRQESEPAGRVDIVATIAAAIELNETRLNKDGIVLHWIPPATPVWVRGGEVRLGQVLVNLINNAADAMAGQDDKIISLSLSRADRCVLLRVADTGPGIDDPEKIFDPFYTTKANSGAEGMGLGLSISYGLVQSFGGAIKGRNRAGGGAEFTVELAPWAEEAAA